MSVTALPVGSALDDATLAEIARVRASDALGATGRLRELFDFLVDRSIAGRPPKEAEIAITVFGKHDSDASRDDPVARVYIHRLRKRLDEFYLRDKSEPAIRLGVPKGEYRIVGQIAGETPEDAQTETRTESYAQPDPGSLPKVQKKRGLLFAGIAAGVLALAAVNVAAWAAFGNGPGADPTTVTRNSAVWSQLAHSERPLLMVIGDDYIFGEYENQLFLKRYIRDPAINSKVDLVNHYRNDPKDFGRFSDVAMQYLPASAAYAIAELAPVFETGRPVEVTLASELTPDRLKTSDIVYIGLLSGLGALRDPVFANSRFSIGESYDQVVDKSSGQTYSSEALLAAPSDQMYRDYGFFSTFTGPAGNRIAVVAGTRDSGLMGVAEGLTKASALTDLNKSAAGKKDFETLFEVKGQKHINLQSHILVSSPIDSAAIWAGERKPVGQTPAK